MIWDSLAGAHTSRSPRQQGWRQTAHAPVLELAGKKAAHGVQVASLGPRQLVRCRPGTVPVSCD